MFGGNRLSLSTLMDLCRALRHYHGAGLLLSQAFRQQAQRGPGKARAMAWRVAEQLEKGDSLYQAMKRGGDLFPPWMLALVQVGERSGMLPEIFGELEKYYARAQKLRRDFLSRIAWPMFQFVM